MERHERLRAAARLTRFRRPEALVPPRRGVPTGSERVTRQAGLESDAPEAESLEVRTGEQEAASGRTASTPVTVLGAAVGVIALAVGVVLILVVIGTRSRNGRDVARNDTARRALDRDDVEGEVDDWSERLGSLGRSSTCGSTSRARTTSGHASSPTPSTWTQSSCERLTDSKGAASATPDVSP